MDNLKRRRGFALVLVISVIFGMALIAGAAFSSATIIQNRMTGNFIRSQKAYYAAEAAAEDSIYRLATSKKYQATNSLVVGSSTASVEITDAVGGHKMIKLTGNNDDRFRSQEINIDANTAEISFYYGVQVGEGGLSMSNNSAVYGSVYSNGSISGSSASISGDAWVAGTAPALDQQSLLSDSDFIFGRSGNQIDAAQSFVPASNQKLNKISLYLRKTGLPGDKTVRIMTDNGNKPSKTLVAAGAYGTLFAAQISQSAHGWIDVVLNTPPTLQSGIKYWIVVDTSASSGNYFSWGKDSTNSYASGEGKYSPNWSASSPVWYAVGGDLAFKTWMGGVTNELSGLDIGGNAHAHRIENCDIEGDAYYTEISGSTVSGTSYPGSDDPSMEAMPISESNINDWKMAAEEGGQINSYSLVSASGSLGPIKINGDLYLSNGAILTLTGTVYVTGNIIMSNNSEIHLGSNYGDTSGVIVTDGTLSVSNNCVFETVVEGTYILMLSTKSGTAATISNNAETVIFYASAGTINISNNATLKEVTAYAISLSNNASVVYESGLASAKFSSGSGASWQILRWEEVP